MGCGKDLVKGRKDLVIKESAKVNTKDKLMKE